MTPALAPQPFWRKVLWPSIAALIALAILLSLAGWQVSRLGWKRTVIAQIEARTAAPAAPFPPASQWPLLSRERDEYARVRLTGTFLHDQEMFLYWTQPEPTPGSRLFGGQGVLVVTPLRLEGGDVVLVTRGFVPNALKDPEKRRATQVTGPQEITGMIRFSEERSVFSATDSPQQRLFYTRDLDAMRPLVRAGAVAPVLVEQDRIGPDGTVPQGGVTRLVIPNRHFEYALTWFGLAATLVGVFAAWLIGQWRALTSLPGESGEHAR